MSTVPNPATTPRDPDLDKDLYELARELFPYLGIDVDEWFATPNPKFDLKTPAQVIGTPWEAHLRNLLRMGKHGMFS